MVHLYIRMTRKSDGIVSTAVAMATPWYQVLVGLVVLGLGIGGQVLQWLIVTSINM